MVEVHGSGTGSSPSVAFTGGRTVIEVHEGPGPQLHQMIGAIRSDNHSIDWVDMFTLGWSALRTSAALSPGQCLTPSLVFGA